MLLNDVILEPSCWTSFLPLKGPPPPKKKQNVTHQKKSSKKNATTIQKKHESFSDPPKQTQKPPALRFGKTSFGPGLGEDCPGVEVPRSFHSRILKGSRSRCLTGRPERNEWSRRWDEKRTDESGRCGNCHAVNGTQKNECFFLVSGLTCFKHFQVSGNLYLILHLIIFRMFCWIMIVWLISEACSRLCERRLGERGCSPEISSMLLTPCMYPIPSMYGIFTYIYHKNQPNIGKYTYYTWMVWV